ncbi:hypothetical protein A2V80_03245 [Candidatus Woesebacteria bacterium RBG_16_39_8b]|uniref:Uncharacterized protein n=1 Tax=Candidatus Woesebacteria bacterium RBG_16_39_8b TaxID=1802482 RepID=A0A1F7XHC9_9BACT|nr:MAG: hypothetical protein A2V80_03245 [Candidatus Woesebacteria bacterium RBG_16_39_8b]
MITIVFFNLVGVSVFLFIFWKRLKEDYIGNQIFGIAAFMLISLILSRIIANQFAPNFWFWFSLISQIFAISLGAFRYHTKLIETFEAGIVAYLPLLSFYFLSDAIKNSNAFSLFGSAVVATLFALFFAIDKRYKKFTWYKSGRVGFSGLFVAALFFVIRSIVALIWDGVLSFSGSWDFYFSIIVVISSIFVIYKLGGMER